MLKNFTNEAQNSPIQHIIPVLNCFTAFIAPKNRTSAELICKDLSMRITDGAQWKFCYDPIDTTVYISKRALEILWAFSAGYFTFYTEVGQKRKLIRATNEQMESIDLASIPEMKEPLILLRWGLDDLIKPNDSVWPDNVDVAGIVNAGCDFRCGAMLYATSFLIMHELSHHRLGHDPNRPPVDSIEQEQQADNMAMDYILGPLDVDDPAFLVRGMGMIIAMTIIVGKNIDTGKFPMETHPRSFDRLFNGLDKFLSEHPDHHLWLFAVCLLIFHIEAADLKEKIKPNIAGQKTFRAMVNEYTNALAGLVNLKDFYKLIA